MIKASFVIPSKNCVHFLPHAVASCLNQDYKGIEVIVVDDGSTDMTAQYTDWLAKTESRAKVIKTEGVGRSEARNIGNRAAQGKYIFVLDADDESMSDRVSRCLTKFNESSCQFLYGSAFVISATNNQLDILTAKPITKDEAVKNMINGICHSTVAYSREFAAHYPYAGGEIADLGIDDWEQQIRALIAGEVFDFIPAHLAAWRDTTFGISFKRNIDKVLEFKTKYLESLVVKS